MSSIRKINFPPCLRAKRKLIKAVLKPPRCKNPVGLGANLTLTCDIDENGLKCCLIIVSMIEVRQTRKQMMKQNIAKETPGLKKVRQPVKHAADEPVKQESWFNALPILKPPFSYFHRAISVFGIFCQGFAIVWFHPGPILDIVIIPGHHHCTINIIDGLNHPLCS